MIRLEGKSVRLLDPEMLRREADNRSYMLSLTRENLMRNYMMEAGLWSDARLDPGIHGGWESPTCALRGHFTGHYLSACAMICHSREDPEILGRAQAMVHDLALCQKEHGNGWAGSIPEKYLEWIARGKPVWAPHYTVHKTLQGLVDMAVLTGSREALEIADAWGGWFDHWTQNFSRETMDDILDVETGGMLEVWADLLSLTGESRYRRLLERYTRSRLFTPLLKGQDKLTNMHANTTIPEILGCARAWEVTGNSMWREIVEAYWKCAVTDRGFYVTGGQTDGEVWSPMRDLSRRLGRKNQEHCTVYNMIRLADTLLRWTGDPLYADYMELNRINGIMAQGYYRYMPVTGYTPDHPETGLVSYFLPMRGGDHKGWGSATTDFFCCHGTLLQANAAHNRHIAYLDEEDLYICQYLDSDLMFTLRDTPVTLHLRVDPCENGSDGLSDTPQGSHPEKIRLVITVDTPRPVPLRLHVRLPQWSSGEASRWLHVPEGETVFSLDLPMHLRAQSLPGDPGRVAFLFGPTVLAGLTDREETLHVSPLCPQSALRRENEREWSSWRDEFITVTQDRAIRFVPLWTVGYEPYTLYFRLDDK